MTKSILRVLSQPVEQVIGPTQTGFQERLVNLILIGFLMLLILVYIVALHRYSYGI